jgi:hypothetical protein
MANVSGGGTLWNLPNLDGILFSKTAVKTPLIDRITNVKLVDNPEFAMSSSYSHETVAQPAITETASLTAPTAVSHVRENETNVTQIFQKKVSLSYAKLSSAGRMRFSEVSTSGYAYSSFDGKNAVQNELDFQRAAQMETIKRELEYSCLDGVYSNATSAAVAYKTRGIVTACTVNTVDAGAAAISKAKINALVKEMADNNAPLSNMVLFVNSFSKTKISLDYAFTTQSRTEGGEAIGMIMTDFCDIEVVFNPFITASEALLCDMSKVAIVFQPVPGKATMSDGSLQNVVWEPLSKTGAGEDWQLYLQAGIDYGSSYFHGSLTNLATA